MGASDNGCGTKTWMAMIVAEELGLPVDRIQIEHADTATTQFATPSGGSKTVPTEAPAGRAAALEVKRQVLEVAAEQLKVPVGDLALREGTVVSTKDPAKTVALSQLTGLQRRGVVIGVGTRGPNPAGKAINPWAAHFAEVEVNTRTGEVKLLRYLAAQDSGRVMNRLTYDNQVIGGITMGVGLALTERRILDRARTGRMVNANFHDYMIPTAMDVPADQTVLPIDPHDTECGSRSRRSTRRRSCARSTRSPSGVEPCCRISATSGRRVCPRRWSSSPRPAPARTLAERISSAACAIGCSTRGSS
jgi:xanthine dehydrogenase YagR molybdenum-binding subunit